MSLLELERVAKSYSTGSSVLEDVSLVLEPGEMVVVLGERRSGRSTLLLIAAGIETPDSGFVRFAGRDLAQASKPVLGNGIAYCRREFGLDARSSVLDQLVGSQMVRGVERSAAAECAWRALERVEVARCGRLCRGELKGEEVIRVALARALTSDPRLLIVDEPAIGLAGQERDGILKLLRSLVDEGMAVLASAGDGTGLLGADRVLALRKGRLRGQAIPALAEITDLAQHRQARG